MLEMAVRLTVKPVSGNVIFDLGVDKAVYGFACVQAAADFGGADVVHGGLQQVQAAVLQGAAYPAVQFAWRLGDVVALAGGNGNVGLVDEGLPFFPGVEFEQAVAAEQPPELCGRKLLAEYLYGIEGVGGAFAHDVAVADGKARVAADGQFGHGEAVPGVGAGLFFFFVVGVACGQEDDRVECQFVGKGAGDVDVPVVDGVESAAEKSYFFHVFEAV